MIFRTALAFVWWFRHRASRPELAVRLQLVQTGTATNDLNTIRFPGGSSQRSAVAGVTLAVLVLFVGVELGFSYFNFPTPRAMFLVVACAIAFRIVEVVSARGPRPLSPGSARTRATISIAWGLALPFALAATTRQFHTHYFGLLILPVLETALYFSLGSTLLVSALGSCSAMLWVAYAAHFTPPYQLGEMLEAATLILMLFTAGALVWLLLDLLAKREIDLRARMIDLEETRGRLVEGEKLAAVGRLASSMAHEIRNPVAIISSALEAAGSDTFSPGEREEMSRVAVTEAKRLEKLTTDFLTYAQPAKFPCATVDVVATVGSMVSIARAQALLKRVTLEVVSVETCLLVGNEDQLQQALLNLLRNAIDASPEMGVVLVHVATTGDHVHISIANAGTCIPQDAVAHIFEPFFTAKRGGTGLGLAIARKIAETHEGSLTLDRNEDDGILFTLSLPARPPAAPEGTEVSAWHVS